MAFNLEKSGDDKKKFDLSKSPVPTDTKTTVEEVPPATGNKKKYGWVLAVLVVVLLAIGAWYFTTRTKPSEALSPANTPAGQPAGNDSLPKTQANEEGKDTALNNNGTVQNKDADTTTTKGGTGSETGKSPVAAGTTKSAASFDAGSSNPGKIDDKTIKDIIAYLSKNSQATLTVYGYASSEGDLGFNQALSQKRADVFKAYLVEKGIEANRINTIAKGVDNPIAPNDTEEGRTKNRRVEIGF